MCCRGKGRSPERAFFVPTGVCFICRRGFLQLCFGFRVPIPIFVIRLCGNQERDGLGYEIGLSFFAVAAAALLAVGCGGDKGGGEDEANYDGWMLTRWKDGTALTGTVYLQLGEDGIFSLYQSIGTFGYARFTGTYALVGDPATGQVLSGTYADGTPWDSSYAVEKMTKRELRLRALKDGVVSVYSGVAIPAAVKDGVTAGRLRSAAQGRSFL